VGPRARVGDTGGPVRADLEAFLAALDSAAARDACYIVDASDRSAVSASGVRGEEGHAASTTAPEILPDIHTLVVETVATPDTARTPSAGARGFDPVRLALDLL